MNEAFNAAPVTPQKPAYYDLETYKAICEKDAAQFVDAKYATPQWAKNIRGEYCDMVYKACEANLNRDEGIFSEDGASMDLAGSIGGFFKKHPHIDYACPVTWRERVLNNLKKNFNEVCSVFRANTAVVDEDDAIIPSDMADASAVDPQARPMFNPNQNVTQAIHDVSNRVWSAWRVMSDLLTSQLASKLNNGEIDEKDFANAIKVRDGLRKMAADIDDMSLAFQIAKKEKDEED